MPRSSRSNRRRSLRAALSQITPWRILHSPDPEPGINALFHTGSAFALSNYFNPELDAVLDHARSTADRTSRTADYCAITKIINRDAPWFFTFQNTYYALARVKLKGVPKAFQRLDRRL